MAQGATSRGTSIQTTSDSAWWPRSAAATVDEVAESNKPMNVTIERNRNERLMAMPRGRSADRDCVWTWFG
jgi:hypothetical protein